MAKKRKSLKPAENERDRAPQQHKLSPATACYQGDQLDAILTKLRKSIESAKLSKAEQLPDKIWIKQQFAVGVNDVTRVLERMPPCEKGDMSSDELAKGSLRRAPLVPLQILLLNTTAPEAVMAVLVASDCSPQLLTKHIPILASSRNVPVIFVKDNKGGSLRLGELVNLKTAIALGVKVRGTCINKAVEVLLGQ